MKLNPDERDFQFNVGYVCGLVFQKPLAPKLIISPPPSQQVADADF